MIPARVKVVGKTYVINVVEKVDDEDSMGEVDHASQRILIKSAQTLQAEQDTLLHETLHAIEHAMDMEFDETEIHRLTAGLLQVLRDNPAFTRFILSKPKP